MWPALGEDSAGTTLRKAFAESGFEVQAPPPVASLIPDSRVGTNIVIVVGRKP